MRVLVTGSNGFVGRNFIRQLEKKNNEITFIDIADPYIPTDARDFFRNNNEHYNLVIHLAAIVGGRANIEGAPLSVAVDLAIDAEAFQWALRTKPDHFVYYSSSAAYPIELQGEVIKPWFEVNQRRLTEADIDLLNIATPDLTYGWSKLTGENLAYYAQQAGLRVHVFRPFSGYGSDQSLDYPFPSFIARAKNRNDPFEIWGDGNQVRDWIHIDDIINATFAAIDNDIQGPINLCTGIPTSFNELAEMVTSEEGYFPKYKHNIGAPKGVHYRVGDPTKLHTFYKPKISLREGINRALRS